MQSPAGRPRSGQDGAGLPASSHELTSPLVGPLQAARKEMRGPLRRPELGPAEKERKPRRGAGLGPKLEAEKKPTIWSGTLLRSSSRQLALPGPAAAERDRPAPTPSGPSSARPHQLVVEGRIRPRAFEGPAWPALSGPRGRWGRAKLHRKWGSKFLSQRRAC